MISTGKMDISRCLRAHCRPLLTFARLRAEQRPQGMSLSRFLPAADGWQGIYSINTRQRPESGLNLCRVHGLTRTISISYAHTD